VIRLIFTVPREVTAGLTAKSKDALFDSIDRAVCDFYERGVPIVLTKGVTVKVIDPFPLVGPSKIAPGHRVCCK
jgi:hypothetical protein